LKPRSSLFYFREGETLSFLHATLSFSSATLPFLHATLSFSSATLPFLHAALSFSSATLSFLHAALSFLRATLSRVTWLEHGSVPFYIIVAFPRSGRVYCFFRVEDLSELQASSAGPEKIICSGSLRKIPLVNELREGEARACLPGGRFRAVHGKHYYRQPDQALLASEA
jgi:hypothetical protein